MQFTMCSLLVAQRPLQLKQMLMAASPKWANAS